MPCEKHKQRKRPATCSACAEDELEDSFLESERKANMDDEHLPPVGVSNDNTQKSKSIRTIKEPACQGTISKSVAKAACVAVKLSEQAKEIQDIIAGPSSNVPGSPRTEEGKYIRVLIEAEIQKALIKVRSELNELKNMRWEHLHIPDPLFCMDLMMALEKDGWKYCDHIKNPRLYGYLSDVDFYLMQRIIRSDNAPMPDFLKTGNAKRYIDKKNGKETQA